MSLPSTFVNQALDSPLRAVGFARVGRRNVWLREARGIGHAVSLEYSNGSWKVRWDVVQPAVGGILYGKLVGQADVAYAGIVTGIAQAATSSGVVSAFSDADLVAPDSLIAGVRLAALQVADWLVEFADARDVIAYLTQDFDQPDRRVTFPTHRPLRLFIAAALAAVDGAVDAPELAAQAAEAIGQRKDRTTTERMQRLAIALA